MKTDGRPTVAFDPEGLVFAVGMDSGIIKMYDARAFESVSACYCRIYKQVAYFTCHKGPFTTWTIRDDYYYPNGLLDWDALKFTNNGQHILISTTGRTNYILDAFEGNIQQRLSGHDVSQIETYGEHTGFSPDSKFAFAGKYAIYILVWNTNFEINLFLLKAVRMGH